MDKTKNWKDCSFCVKSDFERTMKCFMFRRNTTYWNTFLGHRVIQPGSKSHPKQSRSSLAPNSDAVRDL